MNQSQKQALAYRKDLKERAKNLGYIGKFNVSNSILEKFIETKQQPDIKTRVRKRTEKGREYDDDIIKTKQDKEESKKKIKYQDENLSAEQHPDINTRVRKRTEKGLEYDDIIQVKQDKKEPKKKIKYQDKHLSAEHASQVVLELDSTNTEKERTSQLLQLLKQVVEETLEKYPFYIKIVLNCVLVNTENGERITTDNVLYPPKSTYKIMNTLDTQRISEHFRAFLTTFAGEEEIYPNTKWQLDKVISVRFKIFKQYTGGCSNIKYNKIFGKSCTNPCNIDNLCFWRCLAIASYKNEHPFISKQRSQIQRIKALYLKSQAGYESDVVSLDDIPSISERLKLDIEVNTIENGERVVLWDNRELAGNDGANHLGSNISHTIRLHYESKGHFLLINSLVGYGSILKCHKCKRVFDKKKITRFQQHMKLHDMEIIKTNTNNKQLQFSKEEVKPMKTKFESVFEKHLIHPLFFVFDFEAVLLKDDTIIGKQQYIHTHLPCGVVLMSNDDTFPIWKHCGRDSAEKFVEHLESIHDNVYKYKKKILYKKYSKEINEIEQEKCDCSTISIHTGYCNRYKNEPVESEQQKCSCKSYKHQHKTSCSFSKIMAQLTAEYCRTPIVGFNSGKYDMTFVLNAMDSARLSLKNPISKGSQYLKVSFGYFDFLDAWNYGSQDLSLKKFASMWGVVDITKELFPYEWLDNFEKLEYLHLPSREEFRNRLDNTIPTEIEYKEAVNNFDKIGCNNFGEYMMYYCERDVELLLRGLDNYRKLYLETTNLDPLNYISVSQLAFQNFLRNYLNVTLPRIPNENIFHLIDDSIYGGNCQVFERYAKVTKADELIVALDENNLYGHSMSQLLPYGEFTNYYTIDTKEGKEKCRDILNTFNNVSSDISKHNNYSQKCLHNKSDTIPDDPYKFNGFLRVRLSFTREQKNILQYFPPIPLKRKVNDNELNEYMKNLKNKIEEKTSTKKTSSEKIIYDFKPKENYAIYSIFLKFLLENNMVRLDAVYEVLEMPLGYLMRDFIKEMTGKRQEAENDIHIAKEAKDDNLLTSAKSRKAFYKLNANSCFGKTLQSDEKFNKSTFVRNHIQFYKATLGKIHMDSTIIGMNLVEVKTMNSKPKIKAPKYVASAILSNSKMLMLDYVYNCLWKCYTPESTKMLYTDTDSVYVKISGLIGNNPQEKYEMFLSRFPKEERDLHHAKQGELTVGKMKLEHLIEEAVFLKPKSNAFREYDRMDNSACNKGVIMKQNLELHKIENYKAALFETQTYQAKNTIIRRTPSECGLTMNTLQIEKVGLDSYYDKRLLINNIETIPYGMEDEDVKISISDRIIKNLYYRVQKYDKLTMSDFLEIIGCNLEKLIEYIEGQFRVGMCWANYGFVWNLDHILPVSILKDRTDHSRKILISKVVHYTNIQPLMIRENSQKKDTLSNEQMKEIVQLLLEKD